MQKKMIKLNDLLSKSKEFFFLDILIYFSVASTLAGPLMLNMFTTITVLVFFFYSLKKNILNKFLKKNLFFISIFSFIFIVNVFNSYLPLDSLQRFLSILRFSCFSICMIYLLKNYKEFESNLSKILIIILVLIMISMMYQYINGSIFGAPSFTNHGFGLSGIFKDEYIAGSVISKLFFFSLPFIVSFKNKKISVFVFLLVGIVFIILSNQRTPIVMMTVSFFLYLLLTNIYNYKNKLFLILLSFLLGFLILKNHESIYKKVIVKTSIQFSLDKDVSLLKKIKDTQWGAHYLTAIEITKDHKIIGSGLKTFRHICSYDKYESIESKQKGFRCSTHPHNIYLELASELGVFVTLFFLIFMFYVLIKLLLLIKNNNCNSLEYFIAFFILFWPIQITGSFFSSFNGFFYFFGLAIVLFNINNKKLNEKFN
jgi:O-antigen ligase